MRKGIVIVIAVLTLAATSFADTTITTGSKNGNYFKVGNRLSAAIGGKNIILN